MTKPPAPSPETSKVEWQVVNPETMRLPVPGGWFYILRFADMEPVLIVLTDKNTDADFPEPR